ncbi:type II secretion system protein [Undibacterium flavidum]|uniref:Type II secretion system protein H n=1 Tax=Undibacterium flavidum TaxID=2762297 RepID=A0ABR6YFE9_9BURK|nr:type II secretion system protein [Undibacterium flavidum]MBC3875278.1 type II secretion system protein [Undibacterium flavidum]
MYYRSLPTARGFTMVELILVMVVFGILSAIAISRFTARVEFDARGFFDQTLSMVRYAQKTAIAQRRTVWVQASQADRIICLTYVQVNANCQSDGGAPVRLPGEQTWFVKSAPTNVSFGSSPVFAFNALGQPSPNAALNFSIYQNGATLVGSIYVEAETGYVH